MKIEIQTTAFIAKVELPAMYFGTVLRSLKIANKSGKLKDDDPYVVKEIIKEMEDILKTLN